MVAFADGDTHRAAPTATLAYFRVERARLGKLIDEHGMVASRQTIDKCASVILAHLSRDRALALLRDLEKAAGNKSFEETVRAICNEIVRREKR